MREPGPHDNPFDLNKASDFTDAEIAEQWVDLALVPGGLLGIIQPTLRTPMLLLGGKGSGKTHLMRYCSAPVQAARNDGDYSRAAISDGYLGVYIRADGLNTDKFSGKGQTPEYWAPVFSMYFELWLATSLLAIVRELARSRPGVLDEAALAAGVADLFDAPMAGEFADLETLLAYLTRARKSVDFAVNNSSLTGLPAKVVITFSPGKLVFGLPVLLGSLVPDLADVLIVYLIDEVENFTADQQRFLNSLIRYRSGNATIKLGARLYGVKTFETLGSGEPIKQDAEYQRVVLDSILREKSGEYRKLVTGLVLKRLHSFGLPVGVDGALSIESCFEELDPTDFWRSAEADLLPRGRQSDRRRSVLARVGEDLKLVPGVDDRLVAEALAELSVPDHLFLEKAATFYLRKNWPDEAGAVLGVARRAGDQARALTRNDREQAADLLQMIAHFGSDILAQLYHDFRRRVPYAGFTTLVELSQGIPRNLLTDLKHVYRRAQFAGERPFAGGRISLRSQSDGVRDGAAWFWEDAQPGSDGLRVREAVEGLAVLFRTVRFSHNPSECDLCTFSVSLGDLTENSRRVLQIAENWSYLVKMRDGRRNKNSRQVDEKYQLAPMLAPKWEVSEHRRGSIELPADLANAILDPDRRSAMPTLLRRRVARMVSPPGRAGQELFLT